MLLKACLNGFWLGALKAETLHAIDKLYYDGQKMYVDHNYNKSGLRNWEKKAVDNYFQDCKSLLVAAVGGGRELLALKSLGFEVNGFECHPGLQAFANELLRLEGHGPLVKLAERDRCPTNGQMYDGLIVGWAAYTLIQGKKKRVEFLKGLRSQARENSPVLVSFFPRSSDHRYFRVVAAVGNTIRRIFRREPLEIGDDLVPTFVHYFTEKEVAAELLEAGYQLKFYSVASHEAPMKGYGHAVGIAAGAGREDKTPLTFDYELATSRNQGRPDDLPFSACAKI